MLFSSGLYMWGHIVHFHSPSLSHAHTHTHSLSLSLSLPLFLSPSMLLRAFVEVRIIVNCAVRNCPTPFFRATGANNFRELSLIYADCA
jgi:hypothetical protein